MPSLRAQIEQGLAALPGDWPADLPVQCERLLTELERWNRKINLTAIRNPADMVAGHILDSLSVADYVKGPRVLDVGTGAGFPGLPLAIALPDFEFTLLDANSRKISFVRHAAGVLGLGNVTAVDARAEDYAPDEGFDTVTARALATVPEILGLAGRHVREEGVLLALKGRNPAAELEPQNALSGWDYEVTDVTVPGLETHARHVVCLRRRVDGGS